MHSDAFFTMGYAHTICQDYARAGLYHSFGINGVDRPYAIVSDGCSSSPDTDFGSRFLTVAAIDSLQAPLEEGPEKIIRRAEAMRSTFLPSLCLDATLFVAYQHPEWGVLVSGYGDGVVIGRRRNGRVTVWEVGYNNAPAYLSYILDPVRLAQYVSLGYGNRTITIWEDGKPIYTKKNNVGDLIVAGAPPEKAFEWGLGFYAEEFDLVILSTDGIHSFTTPGELGTPAPVPFLEVVNQLLAIKTFTGEFLTRRCKAFFKHYCKENNWSHYDDFGVAAIHLGD